MRHTIGLRAATAAVMLSLSVLAGKAVEEGKTSPAPKEEKAADPETTREKQWALFEQAYDMVREYLGPGDVVVSPDILEKAELGDHFETVNPDRPDTHSAFGNPDAHLFRSVGGSDAPESEGGSYGQKNGGGRRLMVTSKALSLVPIIERLERGIALKSPDPLSEAQKKDLPKAIRMLGSEEYNERERGSNAILEMGVAAVPMLEEALKSGADAEVDSRARALIRKLKLAGILAGLSIEKAVPVSDTWPKDWSKVLGQTVTLEGTAANAKHGALLQVDGNAIWIDGKRAWPAGFYGGGEKGKRLRVTGVVIKRDDVPVFVEKPGEDVEQGIPVRSEKELEKAKWRFLLKNATWTVVK